MRAESGADIAILRGHRFGTQLRTGPITRGDLYSWLPVGAQVAVVEGVGGAEIVRALAAAADGAIDPDPVRWTGGWATAVSGLTYAIDPARPAGARVRDVRVHGAPIDTSGARLYSVVGLWYPGEPDVIAGCARCGSGPRLLRAANGGALDAADVVERHLASCPGRTARTGPPRVRLLRPIQPRELPWGLRQPWASARAAS